MTPKPGWGNILLQAAVGAGLIIVALCVLTFIVALTIHAVRALV